MRIIGSERVPGQPDKSIVRTDSPGQHAAWTLMGWLGLAFVLMGVADITLGFYPLAFGNAEWEFGVISGTLNGFAIPTMGAYLLLSSAMARNKRNLVRAICVGMVLIALILVILGLFYLSVVPVAIRAVDRSAFVLLGMKKAIVKGGVLLFAYWLLYVVGALKGWGSEKETE